MSKYYYYSPKRNAERRLKTNIYYKQMKNNYNNARYSEVKHYNDIYEEYKEKEKYYIPTFIDLDDFDLKNEMDYDYYLETKSKWVYASLEYNKENFIKEICRLNFYIRTRFNREEREFKGTLQSLKESMGFINYTKNEYLEWLKQYENQFNNKEKELNIQILTNYKEIDKINNEIQEMKEYKEKYERNESKIWKMKKEIMQDNEYLQNLYTNINLGFFANLFKKVSDLDYFMSEYERICDKWGLNKKITKERIKEMNKNYKNCHIQMEIAKTLRNNSKGKIL